MCGLRGTSLTLSLPEPMRLSFCQGRIEWTYLPRPLSHQYVCDHKQRTIYRKQLVCRDFSMRLRGLEPPPGFPDTDLTRARLPIPPQPRAVRERRYRTGLAGDLRSGPASKLYRYRDSNPGFRHERAAS